MLSSFGDRINAWRKRRRLRRTERLSAEGAGLDPSQAHEMIFLYDRGFVRPHATGQSITQIHGEVKNLANRALQICVKPGTYFVARGNYQNTVTREEYIVTLGSCTSRSVIIDASCINAGRPIPHSDASFHCVRLVSNDLVKFLERAKGKSPMTVQAGVWALTDGYSCEQVRSHLLSQDRFGNTREAGSSENIGEARLILKALGIGNEL